jgi:hypothetical protein
VSFSTLDKIRSVVFSTLKSVVFSLKKTLLSVETTLAEALFLCGNECRNDTLVFTVYVTLFVTLQFLIFRYVIA